MPLHYCLGNIRIKPNGQSCGMCHNHVCSIISSRAIKMRQKKHLNKQIIFFHLNKLKGSTDGSCHHEQIPLETDTINDQTITVMRCLFGALSLKFFEVCATQK